MLATTACGAAACSNGAQTENIACGRAVHDLGTSVERINTASAIDKSKVVSVVTVCQSRPEWRAWAKIYNVATRLGELRGVPDRLRGTSVVALNQALGYLCANYQPAGGTRACSDTN